MTVRPALRALAAAWALGAGGCGPAAPPTPLILVGIDGLGASWPERTATPALDRLAATGVRAERLVVTFPSLTFPSFYTIATGLYPANHGIVSNTMLDPETGARFSLGDRDAVSDGRWWGGEPIWVTAERQGRRAAAFFWPGTEAAIKNVRPSDWRPYDGSVPNSDRVAQVLAWLDRPATERPSLITLYFSDVDETAHSYPVDSPEVTQAIARVDSALGLLLDGLDARGLTERVNVLLVSDHGMAAQSPERVILLDDYLDWRNAGVVTWHPVLSIRPPDAAAAESVFDALDGRHPHLAVYRRDELPDRLRYRDHVRIPPIIGIVDEGWALTSREYFAANRDRFRNGTHGYVPDAPSMGGILMAAGPAFAEGARPPAVRSVHLYALMCAVLGLDPAPNDGSLDSVRALLREPAR